MLAPVGDSRLVSARVAGACRLSPTLPQFQAANGLKKSLRGRSAGPTQSDGAGQEDNSNQGVEPADLDGPLKTAGAPASQIHEEVREPTKSGDRTGEASKERPPEGPPNDLPRMRWLSHISYRLRPNAKVHRPPSGG